MHDAHTAIDSHLKHALRNIINDVKTKEMAYILENSVNVNNECSATENIECVQSIIKALTEQVSNLKKEGCTLKQESVTLESVRTEKENQIASLQTEIQDLSKSLHASKMSKLLFYLLDYFIFLCAYCVFFSHLVFAN